MGWRIGSATPIFLCKFHLAFHLAFICSSIHKPHKQGISVLHFLTQNRVLFCVKIHKTSGFQAFFPCYSNPSSPVPVNRVVDAFLKIHLAFHLAYFMM
jgi:hypothetical protein